ncbi:MAG: (E)-4-hydroxy-3-methylbut-2-enyl-diphosphate synthase [Treponema sp.]|nr:(E)-4-hydroxy-3-methylbut-2-enyl-diphosphate synthase [Treponema sp.]MCL2251911.1 (E)-4-hydroxy-3-methylbut-2-enyl-diphosphate synthase [Treponema sp.]
MTRIIKIGGFSHVKQLKIGGNEPIAIQTMWKETLTSDSLENAARKIETLEKMGCDLLRFAVPDIMSADLLGNLSNMVSMPLVADIHFDYKIALRCMDYPIAKIRINPGNIGGKDKVRAVLEKASEKGIPIRIGVNAGSLPADLRKRVDEGLEVSEALAEAAEREIEVFNEFGFDNFLVSMKSCTIADNIKVLRFFTKKHSDIPLHVGVTEAGPLAAGVARNSAVLVTLLTEGIGDTVRVSISDTMESEIIAAREIIRAADGLTEKNDRLKCKGVNIVSCPRCGRYGFDTHAFTENWLSKLYAMDKEITVAVMGCEVNGPAEAKNADIGITGAGDKVLIFKHGQIIKTCSPDEADVIFEEELNKI